MQVVFILVIMMAWVLGLQDTSCEAYGEGPADIVEVSSRQPASLLDVFLLTANQTTMSLSDCAFLGECMNGSEYEMLQHVSNSMPNVTVKKLQIACPAKFTGYQYHNETNTLHGTFELLVPPHHPIMQTDLGHKAEASRVAFVEEHLRKCVGWVDAGIAAAGNAYQRDVQSVESEMRMQLRLHMRQRTEIRMRWTIWTIDGQGSSLPRTASPLTDLLKQDGKAARTYTASRHGDLAGEDRAVYDVSCRDYGSFDEWLDWKKKLAAQGLD